MIISNQKNIVVAHQKFFQTTESFLERSWQGVVAGGLVIASFYMYHAWLQSALPQ